MSLNLTDRCRIALGLAILHTERSTLPNGEPWIWETLTSGFGRITARTNGKGKCATHYAKDASGEATLGAEDHGMTVRLSASGAVNRLHRIHVACYQCGEWIDAGHFSQHVGSKRCKSLAKDRRILEDLNDARLERFASTPDEAGHYPSDAACEAFEANAQCGDRRDDVAIDQAFRATFNAPPSYDYLAVTDVDLSADFCPTFRMKCEVWARDPFQIEEYVSAGMVRYRIGQATMTFLDRLNEASAL